MFYVMPWVFREGEGDSEMPNVCVLGNETIYDVSKTKDNARSRSCFDIGREAGRGVEMKVD